MPLFPFGFGLSYTSFRQRIVSTSTDADGNVRVVVADTNTGTRAGADVVEEYVHDPAVTGEAPQQLRAFAKVTLAPPPDEAGDADAAAKLVRLLELRPRDRYHPRNDLPVGAGRR